MFKKKQDLVDSYIGLGSNLGDRAGYINSALNEIANTDNIYLGKFSQIKETKPLGGKKQPNFFNSVAQIKTRLSPEKLLDKLKFIEQKLGRTDKSKKNASRIIDLDILFYGDKIVDLPDLKIPHRQLHLRSFVLDGLCQINPELVHPVLKLTSSKLKERLNGKSFMIDNSKPKLISIAGVIGVGKTTLARGLSVIADAEVIEENYQENPFLAKVYNGNKKYALDSELFFLKDSVSQLNKNNLYSDRLYIADYIFEKAFVYANRWLNQEDWAEYKKHYELSQPKVVKSTLVIYIKDRLTRCLDRIKLRKRPFEQQIDISFLQNLQSDYDKLFKSWSQSPIITVSCDQLDTMDIKSVRNFSEQVKYYIEA